MSDERADAEFDLAHAETQAELAVARKRVAELEAGIAKQSDEVCQTLGRALGFPWFRDDPINFPGATEADGVCPGEHVAETMAALAAARIAELEERCAAIAITASELGQAGLRNVRLAGKPATGGA